MVNRLKLNEKTVREAENLGRDYQIFDTDVRGFSITIYTSGNRAFTLDYRIGGRQRRMTIGRWPEWNTVAARERAKELRRGIDEGIDPLSLRESAREAPRVSDMIERYLKEHMGQFSDVRQGGCADAHAGRCKCQDRDPRSGESKSAREGFPPGAILR